MVSFLPKNPLFILFFSVAFQMGDISTAEDYFNKSEQLLPIGNKITASKIALNK